MLTFYSNNLIQVKIYLNGPNGPNGPGRGLLHDGPGRAGPKKVGPCAPLMYINLIYSQL